MSDAIAQGDESTAIAIKSYFIRGKNALLVRGQFGPVFMDYFVHLMSQGLRNAPEHDEMMKDTLAAIMLHTVSRPQDETTAWTIHMQRPLLNLFATCSTHPGWVSGRVFTEDVADRGKGIFSSQVKRPGHSARQSMVDFDQMDVLEAVEHFYSQSEQRVTRLFRGDDEEMTLISAQPDCDTDWLLALSHEEMELLPETHHLAPMETRAIRFHCGCSLEKLFPLIDRLPEEDLAHIFEDGQATMTCPRCAARHTATVQMFGAWRASRE
jgi:molecular chaperone Hsp33